MPRESRDAVYAMIAYDDEYVEPLVRQALARNFPKTEFCFLEPRDTPDKSQDLAAALFPSKGQDHNGGKDDPKEEKRVLQIVSYEAIDFEHASSHPGTCLVNSYMIRKALIRKHYLSATVERWAAKNPRGLLARRVPRAEAFELDYAEFLEDALVDFECWGLRGGMEANEAIDDEKDQTGEEAGEVGDEMVKGEKGEKKEKEWWILKPGMSDRGQGIRLFSSMEELQGIFDGWEAERPESDDEDDDEDNGNTADDKSEEQGDFLNASHLRHFIAQPYIHPPLLLPADPRKFHLRVYVLCVGSLKVFVWREVLALFAQKEYVSPVVGGVDEEGVHLTNTCIREDTGDGGGGEKPAVRKFWDLELDEEVKKDVFGQVCGVVGEVFEAAAREMVVHFQPLGNAFEVFGVDFLVQDGGLGRGGGYGYGSGDSGQGSGGPVAWLLEVNAFPDFKQTGDELRGVVEGFWGEVVRVSVGGFFGLETLAGEDGLGESDWKKGELVLVGDLDLGRR